jgi:hypothetical protein
MLRLHCSAVMHAHTCANARKYAAAYLAAAASFGMIVQQRVHTSTKELARCCTLALDFQPVSSVPFRASISPRIVPILGMSICVSVEVDLAVIEGLHNTAVAPDVQSPASLLLFCVRQEVLQVIKGLGTHGNLLIEDVPAKAFMA